MKQDELQNSALSLSNFYTMIFFKITYLNTLLGMGCINMGFGSAKNSYLLGNQYHTW